MLVDVFCCLSKLLALIKGHGNILESVFWARQRGGTGEDVQ